MTVEINQQIEDHSLYIIDIPILMGSSGNSYLGRDADG